MLLDHVADGAELTVREDEPDVAYHFGEELERGAGWGGGLYSISCIAIVRGAGIKNNRHPRRKKIKIERRKRREKYKTGGGCC